MVVSKVASFLEAHKKSLNEVSDNCCACNGKTYIDFDSVKKVAFLDVSKKGNEPSSCDMLHIDEEKQHLLFVEFKNIPHNIDDFIQKKEESFCYKIIDSLLLFSFYLQKNNVVDFNDFYNIKKSFILAYKAPRNSVGKINKHLNNAFLKYNFIFENILPIECANLMEILD